MHACDHASAFPCMGSDNCSVYSTVHLSMHMCTYLSASIHATHLFSTDHSCDAQEYPGPGQEATAGIDQAADGQDVVVILLSSLKGFS